jgi:hypothetical protein
MEYLNEKTDADVVSFMEELGSYLLINLRYWDQVFTNTSKNMFRICLPVHICTTDGIVFVEASWTTGW